MTYNCPISGENFSVDTSAVPWDDDGNATIDCPVCATWETPLDTHKVTIAKPVSVGFGAKSEAPS